jgi:transposase
MMGRLNRDQDQLFYAFNLDEAVPADHLVRKIASVLDLSWLHNTLEPHYSNIGRPSIDPELMLRLLILGYVFAIRSERQLVREVQVNLAYRWFCGLGLEDKVPNHSAFSRARNERFRQSDLLRTVFERVVTVCIGAGFVGGDGFAVDASLIEADANKCRALPGSVWNKDIDPKTVGRSVKDYLATLDDAAYGAASPVTPKFVAPSDPAAQWTGAKKSKAIFAYADNYLIDTKHGIIMDVEASRAIRQAEVLASKTMIARTEQRFGFKPNWLAADTAYGTADNLSWLVNEKKISPHIPVIDKSKRIDGTFSRADFAFDDETNAYICPTGKALKQVGQYYADNTLRYFADRKACQRCPVKDLCCPNSVRRKVTRSIYEPARDVARAISKTEAYEETRRHRKKVEMAFAHLKRILKMGRLRLRGPTGVQDEFTLAAIAQNLRKMTKLMDVAQTA